MHDICRKKDSVIYTNKDEIMGYKLSDGLLEKVDMLFNINWMTIKTGYLDLPKDFTALSHKHVIDYALNYVQTKGCDSQSIAFELASLYEYEIDSIIKCIIQLAEVSKSTAQIEQDKWRVVFVIERMGCLSKCPMQACLDIYEFWRHYDFPQDMPNIEPSGGKQAFGGEKHYHELLKNHNNWVNREITRINNAEK
jgi:hypothetical protein